MSERKVVSCASCGYISKATFTPLPINTTGTVDCSSELNNAGNYDGSCYDIYCSRLEEAVKFYYIYYINLSVRSQPLIIYFTIIHTVRV